VHVLSIQKRRSITNYRRCNYEQWRHQLTPSRMAPTTALVNLDDITGPRGTVLTASGEFGSTQMATDDRYQHRRLPEDVGYRKHATADQQQQPAYATAISRTAMPTLCDADPWSAAFPRVRQNTKNTIRRRSRGI